MVMKRSTPGLAPLAKRIKKIEKKQLKNSSETKYKSFGINTSIATGTIFPVSLVDIPEGTGNDERVGDIIRLLKVEVRGVSANQLDIYLLRGATVTSPVVANFGSTIGAFLLDSQLNNFKELVHYRNLYTSTLVDSIKFTKNFGTGTIVKYNGSASTACISNKLWLVVLNRDPSSKSVNFSIRVSFKDS